MHGGHFAYKSREGGWTLVRGRPIYRTTAIGNGEYGEEPGPAEMVLERDGNSVGGARTGWCMERDGNNAAGWR